MVGLLPASLWAASGGIGFGRGDTTIIAGGVTVVEAESSCPDEHPTVEVGTICAIQVATESGPYEQHYRCATAPCSEAENWKHVGILEVLLTLDRIYQSGGTIYLRNPNDKAAYVFGGPGEGPAYEFVNLGDGNPTLRCVTTENGSTLCNKDIFLLSQGSQTARETVVVNGSPTDVRVVTLAADTLTYTDRRLVPYVIQEQAGDADTPGTGDWAVYAKAAGIFIKDDAANVIGPLAAATTPINVVQVTLDAIVAADDNQKFFDAPVAMTIDQVWCKCQWLAAGAPATPPTFVLADGAGNAMTITDTNPTCVGRDAAVTRKAVTAGNSLTLDEALVYSVSNSPTADQSCTLSVHYTVP
jgi:hypothetical protein